MKLLSKSNFNQADRFLNNEARPLEKAFFNYFFHGSESDEQKLLAALEAFQNSDGGFGNGIEPDFKLPHSSPLATSIGLSYLTFLDHNERAHRMIAKALKYLEATFDTDRNGWYSVPKEINNYPHAPWWEYKSDINMTVIDFSWGNPTAELVGYLYKYKEYLHSLDIYSLIDTAIAKLNERTEFVSEHEIYCYIRMYHAIGKEFSSQMEAPLKLAVSQLVNINEIDWRNYVPYPLKFIEFNSENFFGIEQKFIDQNLDYLVNQLEENGKLSPTWQWDHYIEDWEIAKKEWSGVLTLQALLSLLKFNRIN